MDQLQNNIKPVKTFRYKEPPLYQVIMHNDDVTTMDFVVMVLCVVFGKGEQEANDIMLEVHNEGKAVVGEYYSDIAHSKANKAMNMARDAKFPLQLSVQKK